MGLERPEAVTVFDERCAAIVIHLLIYLPDTNCVWLFCPTLMTGRFITMERGPTWKRNATFVVTSLHWRERVMMIYSVKVMEETLEVFSMPLVHSDHRYDIYLTVREGLWLYIDIPVDGRGEEGWWRGLEMPLSVWRLKCNVFCDRSDVWLSTCLFWPDTEYSVGDIVTFYSERTVEAGDARVIQEKRRMFYQVCCSDDTTLLSILLLYSICSDDMQRGLFYREVERGGWLEKEGCWGREKEFLFLMICCL